MIKPHQEKEYKMMIDESTYNLFINDLKLHPFIQRNYYYDINSSTKAMRIREVEGKFIFTLKVKQDNYHDEYEVELLKNSLDDQNVKVILDKFNIKDIKYLGMMETQRATLKMQYGELCVDKSLYLNKIDYEIEYELYEALNDVSQEFFSLLDKYHLEFKTSYKTKFGRFKESL